MSESAWAAVLGSWRRSLAARNRSAETVKLYLRSARGLAEHLGWPDPQAVTRRNVEDYLAALIASTSAQTAAIRYRSLRVFWRWMADEDEVDADPMAGLSAPRVDAKLVPVVGEDDLRALIRTVAAKRDFVGRRDHALLRVLIDCGMRLGEVVAMTVADVDLDAGVIFVPRTKTRRARAVAYGAKTGAALDRYLRARAKQPQGQTADALWLGGRGKGPLTGSGVAQMLERRCRDAGIEKINPHRFRHSAAHYWLAAGGTEGDAMQTFGWANRTMLDRYGSSAAAERARAAQRRLSLGDRL